MAPIVLGPEAMFPLRNHREGQVLVVAGRGGWIFIVAGLVISGTGTILGMFA